jgi:A/G-specific adenine glycosylase
VKKKPSSSIRVPPIAAGHALLRWFGKNARKLPWRTPGLRDPYTVVVSEMMLQQTQVSVVIDYFERWMRAFPDFRVLARAREEKVLKAWEGLGYYRRARNLRQLAIEVLQRFGGRLPKSFEELMELPGLGPYSARSVGSLAFGLPLACVDGNVVRVLARLGNVRKKWASSSGAAGDFQDVADAFLSPKHPGAHNEAMMELGATICTKAHPQCLLCPLRKFCRAYASGGAEKIPQFEKAHFESREVVRAWIVRSGEILLHLQGADAAHLKGLYELPRLEDFGGLVEPGRLLATKTRSITRFKIVEKIFEVHLTPKLAFEKKVAPYWRWVGRDALKEIPLSGPHAKWIGEFLRTRKD